MNWAIDRDSYAWGGASAPKAPCTMRKSFYASPSYSFSPLIPCRCSAPNVPAATHPKHSWYKSLAAHTKFSCGETGPDIADGH